MQITNITVSYSRTQSLGNYSNVKPQISLTAVIEEDDDLDEVRRSLMAEAKAIVYGEIDDALEQDGSPPKFYDGLLYQAQCSSQRQCVVIAPAELDLPLDSNWAEADSWWPVRDSARPHTILKEARKAAVKKDLVLVDCSDGDLSRIPPMRDPGPEPAWHSKKLKRHFENLNIYTKETWEKLAALEHVTADYLDALYQNDAERKLSTMQLIDLIRHNRPWPPEGETAAEPDAYPDPDMWDEDEDEDDVAF